MEDQYCPREVCGRAEVLIVKKQSCTDTIVIEVLLGVIQQMLFLDFRRETLLTYDSKRLLSTAMS